MFTTGKETNKQKKKAPNNTKKKKLTTPPWWQGCKRGITTSGRFWIPVSTKQFNNGAPPTDEKGMEFVIIIFEVS
jgi:hypothetical protein